MLAFYEAVLAYEKSRGAFLPYAARAIKNRLIDHYRTEKRHGNVISLHTPLGGEEDGGELLDTIPDTVDHAGDYAVRTASRREIQEFSEEAGPVRPDLLRCGGQLPPAGADLRRLPPGAGLRPDPAGAAETGGGHGQAAHGGAVRRLRHRQGRPWSGTGSTWWPSCWPSPTAMRSSGAPVPGGPQERGDEA